MGYNYLLLVYFQVNLIQVSMLEVVMELRRFYATFCQYQANSLVIEKLMVWIVSNYITNIKNQESNSRIADPSTSLSNRSHGVALTPDGTVMAVALCVFTVHPHI